MTLGKPIGDMLSDIEGEADQLNNWERQFFNDQKERYVLYGENGIRMSARQIAALEDIHRKVTGYSETPPIDAYEDNDRD